jgi:hypothetical protein
MRADEVSDIHWPFAVFWVLAAGLAILWHSNVARHLVAVAAVAGWFGWALAFGLASSRSEAAFFFVLAAGLSLLFGAGLLFADRGSPSIRALATTLSNYAAVVLAADLAVGFLFLWSEERLWSLRGATTGSLLMIVCAGAGLTFAIVAGALRQTWGTIQAGVASALALIVTANADLNWGFNVRWLSYTLALASMLALLLSGILDQCRPRVVAGWLGLGAVICVITWTVKASLLQRSIFLAAAGAVVIVLAIVLGRLSRKVRPQ